MTDSRHLLAKNRQNGSDAAFRKLVTPHKIKTMKTQIRHLICASMIALMLGGCATPPKRSSAWEYKIVEGIVVSDEKRLDVKQGFGDEKRLDVKRNNCITDGWELVSQIHFFNDSGVVLLKRQKR